MGKKPEDNLDKLAAISKAVDAAALRNAVITEKEALIYAELFKYDQAIVKFEELLKMEKANFSFLCMEKYCNVRAKKYVRDFLTKKAGQAELVKKMEGVILNLQRLIEAGETAERYNLLGSAHKRMAIVSAGAGDAAGRVETGVMLDAAGKWEAYKKAAWYYRKAYYISSNENKIYSLTNWLEMEGLLFLFNGKGWGEDSGSGDPYIPYMIPTLDEALGLLKKEQSAIGSATDVMSYWDLVSRININLSLLLIDKEASKEITFNSLTENLRMLWQRAGSPGKKAAELEHFQFLILALYAGGKGPGLAEPESGISDPKDEDIEKYIEKIKQALLALYP